LAEKRRHHSIPIPAAKAEFLYLFLKKVLRENYTIDHYDQLVRLYMEDSAGCLSMLHSYFQEVEIQHIKELVESKNYIAFQQHAPRLKHYLVSEGVMRKLSFKHHRCKHLLSTLYHRLGSNPGLEIFCLGPDGSGKSTSIMGLEQAYRPFSKFKSIVCVPFPNGYEINCF
jgi:ABC-type siderophore export system fused ATPase/permease subunit